jgi:hypothetical protein
VSSASHHHVVDHWQSRHHQSHAQGHAHHNGDVECLLEGSDSDAETDSTTDDVEPQIGRKRQIIGILVRLRVHSPSHDRYRPITLAIAGSATRHHASLARYWVYPRARLRLRLRVPRGRDFVSPALRGPLARHSHLRPSRAYRCPEI